MRRRPLKKKASTICGENVLTLLKEVPGLLAGYWLATRDRESLAIVFFENEEPVQEMANIGPAQRPSTSASLSANLG